MASTNQSVTLFSGQSADGTGSAADLLPLDNKKSRTYSLQLSGDLGSGTFELEVSFDQGTTYSPWCVNGSTKLQQTILGYCYDIVIDKPTKVRAVLAGATTPNLTAKLHYGFEL